MKKGLFCALSILVFVGAIASYFFVGDKTAPEIKIKSTPVLDENSGYDDLINYAEANDENLKSFVIENNSLLEILENKYITYVAIDKNNNIAKATVDVEIDPKYESFNIVCIKEPIVQINTKFDVNDFFVLQNEYGINLKDKLIVSEVDTSKVGECVVSIKSSSNLCDPLETKIRIINDSAPKITLNSEVIDYYANSYWSDYDFINIIDVLEDDVDSKDYLLENISIDWKDVLNAQSDGYVTTIGTFDVTYTVTDSDSNITKAMVKVILAEPLQQETEEANLEG